MVYLVAVGCIGGSVVGKDVGVLPLEFPEFFVHFLTIFLGYPSAYYARVEGLQLVLVKAEAGGWAVQVGHHQLPVWVLLARAHEVHVQCL